MNTDSLATALPAAAASGPLAALLGLLGLGSLAG